MNQEIVRERSGSTLLLRLNRPDRLNAVSPKLYAGLVEAIAESDEDADIRVIVITGAGRAFCVGADLKAHAEAGGEAEARRQYVDLAQDANRALQRSRAPVVAAVNGHAIGAGLELALSADFIVAAREAKLRLPEVGLGTFFGGGVTARLPARVGIGRARSLMLLGRFVTGEEAERMGLVDEALPAGEVLPRALDLAAELAEKAPVSMRLARELLARAPWLTDDELLEAEADALLQCMDTRDWREGVRAFAEKRAPTFEGR
jgi:enoyl-CoA hydratase